MAKTDVTIAASTIRNALTIETIKLTININSPKLNCYKYIIFISIYIYIYTLNIKFLI